MVQVAVEATHVTAGKMVLAPMVLPWVLETAESKINTEKREDEREGVYSPKISETFKFAMLPWKNFTFVIVNVAPYATSFTGNVNVGCCNPAFK